MITLENTDVVRSPFYIYGSRLPSTFPHLAMAPSNIGGAFGLLACCAMLRRVTPAVRGGQSMQRAVHHGSLDDLLACRRLRLEGYCVVLS